LCGSAIRPGWATRQLRPIGQFQLFLFKLGVLAIVVGLAAHTVGGDQQTKYGSTIPMSSEQVSVDGICINFNASMNSSEFKGLERVEAASDTEFHRSKRVIRKFPDLIDVMVWASPYLCDSLDRNKQPKGLRMNTIESLTFRFSWKHDFDLRPTQTVDYKKKHFPGRNIWLFYFQVKGTEIP